MGRKLGIAMVALTLAVGCGQWTQIRPDQLAVLGGDSHSIGAEITGRGQAHDVVVVYTADGRTAELNRRFDARVTPRNGPTRFFAYPVRVEREGSVLRISGSNRPEAWIRLSDVIRVEVWQ